MHTLFAPGVRGYSKELIRGRLSAQRWSGEQADRPTPAPRITLEKGSLPFQVVSYPFPAYMEAHLNRLKLKPENGSPFTLEALDLTGLEEAVATAWKEGAHKSFYFSHRHEKLHFEIRSANRGLLGVIRDRHGMPLLRSLHCQEQTELWDEGNYVVRLHLLNSQGESMGRVLQRFSANGMKSETLNIFLRKQARGRGLAKGLFQSFCEEVPVGCELQLVSANGSTNLALDHLMANLKESAHPALEDSDAKLTEMALSVSSILPCSGLLWIHLLQSAGWQNIRIRRNVGCANYLLKVAKAQSLLG